MSKTLNRRRLLGAAALLPPTAWLAACAPMMTQVASGEALIKNRLAVTVASPWNQFERGLGDNVPTWTVEGISVDALQFYVGLKSGELLAPTPREPKGQPDVAFKSEMQNTDLLKLFETLWTRDGSRFTLDRAGPHEFAGGSGIRAEFTLVRKSDEVTLKGLLYARVHQGELWAIVFRSPRLGFFGRQQAAVEALVRSARIRA